ncbi:MAG TPA: aspartyl protease family protein, partial [Caulobacteraceae bacterium]
EGPPSRFRPAIEGAAKVNGSRIKVVFDTGAASSLMALSAARRLGLGPDKPGVVFQGLSGGVGPHLIRIWIAPVELFEIGVEKIEHTRLRVGDTDLQGADMLLGADFFLSHRVYVANSQHRLYFTYNGGPVFNLAAGAAQPPSATESPPPDAAGFARRAAAEAARREFTAAVADFSKAMELDPKQPDYAYQRGETHLVAGQSGLAMADFDRTLALAPADSRALIARASLRLAAHDNAGALADLDAARRALSGASDDRFVLAALYRTAEAPALSLAELDLWIKAHPDDRKLAVALSGRCWARMLLASDLDKATADCQHALRLLPSDADALDGRGFVRLRQGDLDKAIADFNAVASRAPRNAWPLYGRGLAMLKEGHAAEGKADIAAAAKIDPTIAKTAAKYGLTP